MRRALLPVLASLLLPASAQAVGWVSSGPLSVADRIPIESQVAIGSHGERVVAWAQLNPGTFVSENVSVRVAPAHGGFAPAQTFPGAGEEPRLAVTSNGTLVLAWLNRSDGTVHIARRAPGQTRFVEATPLTPLGGEGASQLQIAVAGNDVVAAFITAGPSGNGVWSARLPAQGSTIDFVSGTGPAGSVALPGPGPFLSDPGIAVDGSTVYVTWQEETDGQNGALGVTRVKVAKSVPVGTFDAPQTMDTVTASGSSTAVSTSPRIASGGGHVYAVWERSVNPGALSYQDLATGDATHTILADPFISDLHIGVDASGRLYVAGDGFPGDGPTATVAETEIPAGPPAAGAPSPQLGRLTAPGIDRRLTSLAVASDGSVLVLASPESDSEDQTTQVQAFVHGPRARFGALENVSGLQDTVGDFQESVAGAAAPGGRTVAVWAASDHSGVVSERLHISERDVTPPGFSSVSVPRRVAAGQRATFRAAVSDNLSTPTVSWDFGDGTQASGSEVSHAFGHAGARTVTITATDAVGNRTRLTGVVAIGMAGSTDHTPPVLERLSLSAKRFSVGQRGTVQIALAHGTAFRLRLSERASVAIVIERGRRVVGTLVRAGRGPGEVRLPFSGRIGRTALTPGRYRAVVVAIDGAGNRSRARTVGFTVVRR